MACVSKRRGKWVCDYRDPDGVRHWETFETRKAAEQELAKHVTAIKDGNFTAPNYRCTVLDAYARAGWSSRSRAPITALAPCCGRRRRRCT